MTGLDEPRTAYPGFTLYAVTVLSFCAFGGQIHASENVRILGGIVGTIAAPFAVCQSALWMADSVTRVVTQSQWLTVRLAEIISSMAQPNRYLYAMALNIDADEIEDTTEPNDDGLIRLRPDLPVSRAAIAEVVRQTRDGVLPSERSQPVEARPVFDALAEIGAIHVVRGNRPATVRDDELWNEVKRLIGKR